MQWIVCGFLAVMASGVALILVGASTPAKPEPVRSQYDDDHHFV